MDSSYTWVNSKEVTSFLDYWFLWDLMVKNSQLPHQQNLFKGIFLSLTLFITTIDFSLLIYLFISLTLFILQHEYLFFSSELIQYNFLLFHPSCYRDLWHNITVLHPVTCIAFNHTYIYIYWCYWDFFKARGRRAGVLVPSSETFHADLLSLTLNSCHSRVWKIWFGCQNSKQWVNE